MNNFMQWILNEMPISKFQLAGDWGPKALKRGWDNSSIGILTSEKGVQKIKNKWKNTEVNFDMYFVRKVGAMQHLEIGEVPPEFVKENLGMDIQPNEEAVTILFTQNRADGRIPMTAWTIGHRVGHAMARGRGSGETARYFQDANRYADREVRDLWRWAYGDIGSGRGGYYSDRDIQQAAADNQKMNYLIQALGTMKSARDGKIRNFNEFVFELFGQYLLEGRIKFRTPPKQLGKRSAWGNDYYLHNRKANQDFELEEIGYKLENLADVLGQEFSRVLHSAVGKVFVM